MMSVRAHLGIITLVAISGVLALSSTGRALVRWRESLAANALTCTNDLDRLRLVEGAVQGSLSLLTGLVHGEYPEPSRVKEITNRRRERVAVMAQELSMSSNRQLVLLAAALDGLWMTANKALTGDDDLAGASYVAVYDSAVGRLRDTLFRSRAELSSRDEEAKSALAFSRGASGWTLGIVAILCSAALFRAHSRVARSISKPLQCLAEAIDHALQHDQPVSHSVEGPREIRSLTRTILSCVGSLEGRLQERTEAMDKANNNLRLVNMTLKTEMARSQALEEQFRYDAFHDTLTDLPNRQLLLDRLRSSIERSRRNWDYKFAVLFVDLDNFKVVNDSLGHSAGDRLLVEVANRLAACLRSMDTVSRMNTTTTARLGGDEFVILLEGIQHEREALIAADRVQEQLAAPIEIDGHPVVISASIGIALNDRCAGDGEDLLRNADTAMYRAKQSGKKQHAMFDETMYESARSRLQLENELRAGLSEQRFELFYQPIIRLADGVITGFEALLRWRDASGACRLPADFISIAEETGLIVPIGRWVLTEASRQLGEWREQSVEAKSITMNINISKRQLMERDFAVTLAHIIGESGVDPKSLNLEVTESTVIEVSEHIPGAMHEVKRLGCNLHMDDFGTGYSSLSYLHKFPIDVLKIDRMFVHTMGSNPDYATIVQGIMLMAHNLGMTVVAEGIERRDELAPLIALGCDFGQGYYFAKPLKPEAALALLKSGGDWPTPWPKELRNPIASPAVAL